MKTYPFFFIVFLLLASQIVLSQNDTIKGILLDINNKAIKNYPVTLGNVSPATAKTDRNGIFAFPDADLQDTLFVADKKGKNVIAIPINGYHFVTIQSLKGDFNTKYLSEPDEQILHALKQREGDRMRNLNTLRREDIVHSGCHDVFCLLKRLSGVSVYGELISIRGGVSSSLQSTASPLVVLDGIPMTDDFSLNSIPVDEINEITVLKDASIYGVRGANGAIIINTLQR